MSSLTSAALAQPATAPARAAMVKPIDWLKAQPAPRFAETSTLPPLTRWGWSMSYEVAKELADRWGYAVEFAGYVSEKAADEALAKPDGRNGRVLALVASDPKKYKLGVLLDRQFPKEMPPEAYLRDAQGNFILDKSGRKGLSSEMPEQCLKQAGQLGAAGLAKLRTRCPIAIIQNGGEYGLGVLGFVQKQWEQDPKVLAGKGGQSWHQYISQRKSREQKAVADAVRAAVPDRMLYVFYTCGGGTHRRGTLETWRDNWGWEYADMRACTDIATNEYYYHDFNSGWIGKDDMLTQALAARGHELRFGVKNSYDYVCAGYKVDDKAQVAAPAWDATQPIDNNARAFGDLQPLRRVLEVLVHLGHDRRRGGVFLVSQGRLRHALPGRQAAAIPGADGDPGACARALLPPGSLPAQGDLLPGPGKHVRATDQPACEFPTGHATCRVLARKMAREPRWLIAAWASDGVDGPATVEIPELGSVTLQARAIGSLYTATLENGKPSLRQVDRE
ncbi:MAG: hypothetical protein QM813_06100 [Verrucomicrobiota bacterium]